MDLVFRYEKEIIPRIERNEIVICDRYIETLEVRDGIRGVPQDLIHKNIKIFKKPDITIFLDIDKNLIFKRMIDQMDKRSDYILGLDFMSKGSKRETMLSYLDKQRIRYQEIFKDYDDREVFIVKNESEKEKILKNIFSEVN
ncbi:hypothetical protein FHQ08_12530 [Lactobacillus sp. CC-MHH1034]|uniref:dTMP kinase n=1 Tax=Agrilactobacillus fermenti TaxID=2586909 RepID=UPI001E478071|nr:hypothetical protein [Agrilactobacillus fermenti]MCD2257512.1 hypothetical protein [Agrilactobacillus fermenti]